MPHAPICQMWVYHEQMHNPTAGLQQHELFHILFLSFLSFEYAEKRIAVNLMVFEIQNLMEI